MNPADAGSTHDAEPFYVVTFGRDGAVGCFLAESPLPSRRRQAVLVRTPRGLEVGSLLGPANVRQTRLLGPNVLGDLVRPLGLADQSTLDAIDAARRDLLDHAELLRPGFDVVVLDAEVFFDRRNALVHVLDPDPDRLGDFASELGAATGLVVRIANLNVFAEPDDHGCGKPDCGAGGCSSGGCSTGGCSTGCGSGGEPVDLRPYFSHLRDQMESHARTSLI